MKVFLLCNLCWTSCKPNTRIMASTECNPNTVHIWCEKCVEKFMKYGSCVCKICNLKGNLSNLYFVENPNQSDFDLNQLIGFPPQILMEMTQKAILFWNYQKSLQFQKSKSHIALYSKKLKQLTQKHQSQQLKHQNEINNTTQKMNKLRLTATKYCNGFKKLHKNCKKLQNDLKEKTRQFDIINAKYKELLRKYKRKSLSSNHSPRSVLSSGSKQSGNTIDLTQTIPETVINANNNKYNRHKRNQYKVVPFHPFSQQIPQNQQREQRRKRQSIASNPLPHVSKKGKYDVFESPFSLMSGVSGLQQNQDKNGIGFPFSNDGLSTFGEQSMRNTARYRSSSSNFNHNQSMFGHNDNNTIDNFPFRL